ncbi:hypothetical protein N7448_001523 [Penicillium atrosanguineum]|nr:hypothetical protein N7448_001523 [Penicillium atrosanguineum]
MSFLDSVLTSLQTGKPSPAPLSQPPAPPATSSTVKTVERKPATPTPRPALSVNASGGIKRKAEDQLPRPSRPEAPKVDTSSTNRAPAPPRALRILSKPAPPPATSLKPASPKPAPRNGPGAATKTAPAKSAPIKAFSAKAAPPKPSAAPSKAPPKGSFAEIMARAKALQDQAPAQVGMLRHQSVPKERLSKVERKRRMMEAQAQEKAARRPGQKPAPGALPMKGNSGVKKESEGPAYKGTAKPPPKAPEGPLYRGTAGLPGRGGNDRRAHGKRRRDEYLGTDEEDEGDYGGYDDHYSDASSDMEAGFDDVAGEEDAALRSARKEDEKELAMEMAAKLEKQERQRKLAALANRTKR